MDTINYKEKGIVFDIQRFSIHDGPGIRTIVFLKGCPLRCKWCSNPESQSTKEELMFKKELCISCGNCLKACKIGAIDLDKSYIVDKKKCTACSECTLVCPSGALFMKGKYMSVEEVMRELKKDETQYYRSDGGITLSGGEALFQRNFARELLKACKAKGYHTAMETEGYTNEETIRDVIPYVDLVLLDIKSMDTNAHKKYTGVDNQIILKNAKIIQELTNVHIRIPVIPDFNARKEDIIDIVNFVKTLENVKRIHILPYHRYGENKYKLLGREYEMNCTELEDDYVQELKSMVEKKGLTCIIGG